MVKSVTWDNSVTGCMLDTEFSPWCMQRFFCHHHVYTKPGPTPLPIHWVWKFISTYFNMAKAGRVRSWPCTAIECQLGMCRTSPNLPYIFMAWCVGTGTTYSEIQYYEQLSNCLSSIVFVSFLSFCLVFPFISIVCKLLASCLLYLCYATYTWEKAYFI